MLKTIAAVAVILGVSVAGGILGTAALQDLLETPSVTINNGDPVPNMTRPTELHIQNVTRDECDDLGGRYDAKVVLCKNVDY